MVGFGFTVYELCVVCHTPPTNVPNVAYTVPLVGSGTVVLVAVPKFPLL